MTVLQVESSSSSGHEAVSVDCVEQQHKRPAASSAAGAGEFTPTAKPRSVAEVQPMQKSAPAVEEPGPPTPVGKPPEELVVGTKRTTGDEGDLDRKCRKCSGAGGGQLVTELRPAGTTCSCVHDGAAAVHDAAAAGGGSDAGCAVCLEGFNDVRDWQRHVTSQHMMRSCVCKSCDVGFTNASALRRHLAASHGGGGARSPGGAGGVAVEYRCLFCPEVFTDEPSLYAHTRAHEQHYATTQRAPVCARTAQHAGRPTAQTLVQTAVPDTTCPEEQRSTAATDVTSLDTAAAVESENHARLGIESEMARKNIEIKDHGDVTVKKSAAPFNSKKASILRRLSAGMCN